MKKYIYIFALLCAQQLSAQSTVELNIHHKLGDSDFALNTEASNNLGDTF